jgi:hypothetical protein
MPADRQPLLDRRAAARTGLAGAGRRHGYGWLPSVCCFENKDAQERAPGSITDALGEVVIPDHVGRRQVFMIDDIVGLDEV